MYFSGLRKKIDLPKICAYLHQTRASLTQDLNSQHLLSHWEPYDLCNTNYGLFNEVI